MYHKCGKRDCNRLVSEPAIFCCVPCLEASQSGTQEGPHTPGCDARAAERAEMGT
jgi:hypothetical protein